MTNQQTIERAITKAIDGGFDRLKNFEVIQNETVLLIKFESKGRILTSEYKTLVFNHDFAKALWGEEKELTGRFNWVEPCPDKEGVYEYEEEELSCWQYHLQMMVISDDPIQYLAKNI